MYVALCRFDSIRTMESVLGHNVDEDIVSGAIAAVSWFHLCWVCNEMRAHFFGVVYLMYHISYMIGYVSGENSLPCNYPAGINESNYERFLNETWQYWQLREIFTKRIAQKRLNVTTL